MNDDRRQVHPHSWIHSVLVAVMYHQLVVLPEHLRSSDWTAGISTHVLWEAMLSIEACLSG